MDKNPEVLLIQDVLVHVNLGLENFFFQKVSENEAFLVYFGPI